MEPRTVAYIDALAAAPTLEQVPPVVDATVVPPANPPRAIQEKFVGASYGAAYTEAEQFVARAFEHLGDEDLADLRVLDFGSGWGRIIRMLLLRLGPEQVFSTDVDISMTALVQSTLPGVNATTNAPMPPSMFRTSMFDAITAFSVFSHLSETAHRAWVHELARVVRPGGKAFITVLEADFLQMVAAAQSAVRSGATEGFTVKIAAVTDDAESDLRTARQGRFVYAGLGDDDGPRSRSFYAWAVAPRAWLERTWSAEGFRLEAWIPSGELFDQAMAVFVLDPEPSSRSGRAGTSALARLASSAARRLRLERSRTKWVE